MRLTVSRVGVTLLITSILLLQLLWSLHHYYDGGHSHLHALEQSKNATPQISISSFPPPPPLPIVSFPQLRPAQEWLIPIQQNTSRSSSSQPPPTLSLKLSTSKPSPTLMPYVLPLHPLLNPTFTPPQGVSQPSSRWDGSIIPPLKMPSYTGTSALL